ncbi:MAG: hypothetical protein CVV02_07365 [Firmicutes bacterium HGW-Firmicutes-7]|nr:MAG: hypothetical protein CVV02_07365 [Firmicutes bacterium HGW-Firmicutes-7]
MNNEFQLKLQLYKEGKLKQKEVEEIECEIDKFIAIMDYLNEEDKAFWKELKQQLPTGNGEETKLAKPLKRKVNLRILMMTAISVFSALIIIIFLYFLSSNIVSSLFGLTFKESYVKRDAMVQLTQIFHPQYDSHKSSVEKSLFAQQKICVSLDNTVGNTVIDETEVTVKYSFGKPVKSETAVFPLLPMDGFALLSDQESDPISGFKILEDTPQGTTAKIFIEFNKALTPQQLKENFITQMNTVGTTTLEITPLAAIGSEFVLANPSYYMFTPVFPYDSDNTNGLEGNDLRQNQYESMNDTAHKESFIGNLNLIKSNQELLQVMYYEDMFENINIDDLIKHVENNGVEYVGVYISANSKELLKLKDNPMIHCLRVENIVVW